MVDIIHRIGIRSTARQVYDALSTIKGISHWWTEEVEGEEKIGGKIKFRFRSETGEIKGEMIMEVKALNPDIEIRWNCIAGPDEWIGTDITFQLSQQDDQIIIIFGNVSKLSLYIIYKHFLQVH